MKAIEVIKKVSKRKKDWVTELWQINTLCDGAAGALTPHLLPEGEEEAAQGEGDQVGGRGHRPAIRVSSSAIADYCGASDNTERLKSFSIRVEWKSQSEGSSSRCLFSATFYHNQGHYSRYLCIYILV